MKRSLLLAITLILRLTALPCPACSIGQPRFLQGIAHGPGPQDALDYGFLLLALLIFGLTLFYSVKWLIRPGEASVNHIKHFILNE